MATAAHITRAHVEAFIAGLAATRSASTASNRYRALQQWFGWMVEEEETPRSPMTLMRAPVVPEAPVPVLSNEQLVALLKACDGREFVDRQDTATVRLFVDTVMRRSELAALTLEDLDLDDGVAVILGKGRRPRACPFGARTAQGFDRYLRLRARHTFAGCPALCLGEKGRRPMTANGVAQMVRRRGEQAGILGYTPTDCGTPRHTSGWPAVALRATRCGCSAGSPGRCSVGTPPARPTNAPGTHTAVSPWGTGSDEASSAPSSTSCSSPRSCLRARACGWVEWRATG